MSFQGDVAGVGLAELMQGLARSEREGVLLLQAKGLQSRLGLRDGQLYLLPSSDESADAWRTRCRQAWVDPMPLAVEERRMAEIARAARLESVFGMLEASSMHFRFTPGPITFAPSASVPGSDGAVIVSTQQTESLGQGFSPEYLLLEHARLADESSSSGSQELLSHDLLRALDPLSRPVKLRSFLQQFDGRSSLAEVADRLALPLRQCRAQAREQLGQGALRVSSSPELLVAAQREIRAGQHGRAASRLTGWLLGLPPGPIELEAAQLLEVEWSAKRLASTLRQMDARAGRELLRRMERSGATAEGQLERWEVLRELRRSDNLAALHTMAWRCRFGGEQGASAVAELLRLAAAFQERGLRLRSAASLRLAAQQCPTKVSVRSELGARLIEIGLPNEGGPWLVAVARDLLAARQVEAAMASLRSILESDPENREAQSMLVQGRALSSRRKRRRAQSLVALSALLCLALVALVHVRSEESERNSLEAIASLLNQPEAALAQFDLEFGDAATGDPGRLRAKILEAIKLSKNRQRDEWMANYSKILHECTEGDPRLGLDQALELPEPPRLGQEFVGWPTRADLLSELANRLERMAGQVEQLDQTLVEKQHVEDRNLSLLAELDAIAAAVKGTELLPLRERLHALSDKIEVQRETRSLELAREAEHDLEHKQDQLLATARAQSKAGELEYALRSWDQLLSLPGLEPAGGVLRAEAESVRAHLSAVRQATVLAQRGQHSLALETLQQGCPNPREHLLPSRIQSVPSGLRIRLQDGSTRVTPFTLQTAPGEHIALVFEGAGFESQRVELDNPQDLLVELDRIAELAWSRGARIETAPIACGEDHLVADRAGHLERIDPLGQVRWALDLHSLGGVARLPLFLPGAPGKLLVVTEDGSAWMVDTANGSAEGPSRLGSPPAEGPLYLGDGMLLRLADNRVLRWRNHLQPEAVESIELFPRTGLSDSNSAADSPVPANLQLLRRGAQGASELHSNWTGWNVRVEKDHYRVSLGAQSFRVSRKGAWIYLAWEAPNALSPEGRLWISDEEGLRGLRP